MRTAALTAGFHPCDGDQSPGTPGFHPCDEDPSPGTPGFHPSDEDPSPGTPGLPVSGGAGSATPATSAVGSSRVALASSSTALQHRARKLGFSRKSAGGYPQMASSEKTARRAPASAARRVNVRIFSRFPVKSPTVG